MDSKAVPQANRGRSLEYQASLFICNNLCWYSLFLRKLEVSLMYVSRRRQESFGAGKILQHFWLILVVCNLNSVALVAWLFHCMKNLKLIFTFFYLRKSFLTSDWVKRWKGMMIFNPLNLMSRDKKLNS